jgi:hypothetical protein
MPSNKYTQQTPLEDSSIRTVLAERVYIADADTDYTDPTAALAGDDPGGDWDDLGIVAGSKATLTYNKETKFIETGIDKVRRGAYLTGKNAQIAFTLEQFDMAVLELVTGLSATSFGSPVVGSKIFLGQEDVVEKALLIIGTNKVDGKEHQIYCKKAAVVFQVAEQDDARVMNVTADLYSFLPTTSPVQTVEALMVLYILEADE